jgi:hypothetical protein
MLVAMSPFSLGGALIWSEAGPVIEAYLTLRGKASIASSTQHRQVMEKL